MLKPVIKIILRNHIFKIAAALTGLIFIGFFGLIFGFIGGALIDQLRFHLRDKNKLKRFFLKPESIDIHESDKLLNFIEAAALSIVFYLCIKEPAKTEVLSSVSSLYFPEAPANTCESLQDLSQPDFQALAAFFGSKASSEQKQNLNRLINSIGLKPPLLRKLIEAPEGKTARLIAAADFLTFGSTVNNEEPENSKAADYALLGLNQDASKEEIKHVYYNLAAHFHPDSGTELTPEQREITENAFKKISTAYERIK